MSRDDERLASALRENLRRRKSQARAREALEDEPAPAPVPADTAEGGDPA